MHGSTLLTLFIFGILSVVASDKSKRDHKIVTYWGQNAVFNSLKAKRYWERDLTEFCKGYDYDVISLAFLNNFFDALNKDKMPGLNFAYHCTTGISPEYPKLLRCPKIEAGIKECQKQGIKVLMSLGGAAGSYGFTSESQAKLFSYRIYHLLLEGNDLKNLRPFGSAVLDGIDLNIEHTDSTGNKYYTAFVKELRSLEKTGNKKYTISAAPQCPFPDSHLGPSEGKVLGDVPELIDEIYIQFYNNWCNAGNKKAFDMRFREWMGYSINFNGPVVYVGLPSNEGASGNKEHYRPIDKLTELYKEMKNTPKLGGIMIWDASFDQNNMINDKHYSQYIAKMMMNEKETLMTTLIPRPPTESTTMITETTKAPTKATQTTMPATTAKKPTETAKTTSKKTGDRMVSCYGKSFGYFPHPNTCRKFIHCAHGTPYVKDCPSSLYFNPKINVCDWPYNVDCSTD